MDPSTLAQLLSGVFSGAAGLSQLGQAGTNAAAGASAADPFASQRGQYAGLLSPFLTGANQQLYNGIYGTGNILTNLSNANTNVGANAYTNQAGSFINSLGGVINSIGNINAFTGVGANAAEANSANSLASQLSQLSSNYMSNPAIQAQYKLGLDSAQRGLQAQGYGASGQQLKALSDYGQQFASSAYQQQFQDILASNQQEFNQNMGVTQLNNAVTSQNFAQGLQQQQLIGNVFGQALSGATGLSGQVMQADQQSVANNLSRLTSEGSLQTALNSNVSSTYQGLLSTLSSLSGATTGSPSTAGAILSGQFANTNTALGNLGSGLVGLGSGLNSAFGGNGGGLGDLLSNLFSGSGGLSALGGGISTFLSGLGGGIGSLGTSLGASTAGGFESLLAGGADSGVSSGLSALFGL